MIRVLVVLALLLVALPARAADPKLWSVDASVSLLVLGPGERTTGGVMPTIGASRSWQASESVSLYAGLSGGAFGLGGDPRWIGFLVGPHAGIEFPLGLPGLRGAVHLDAAWGRVPICTDWGLCIRYWGLYPGAEVRASYDVGGGVALFGALRGRYVDSLPWNGVGWEPRAGGLIRF